MPHLSPGLAVTGQASSVMPDADVTQLPMVVRSLNGVEQCTLSGSRSSAHVNQRRRTGNACRVLAGSCQWDSVL